MVIKSGEGVVYLTRPQKYFSSSPHIHKKQIFHSKQKQQSEAPQSLLPRLEPHYAKTTQMAPISQNTAAQHLSRAAASRCYVTKKYEKNLTFAPKAVIIYSVEFKNKNRLIF